MVVSGNLEKVCPEKSQNHFMTLKPVRFRFLDLDLDLH